MYSQYYEKTEIRKQIFEKILTKIAEEENFDSRSSLAQPAAYHACSNNTGYFTSSMLEKFFTAYAKTWKTDLTGITLGKNGTFSNKGLIIPKEWFGGRSTIYQTWKIAL